jgi:hypothetical protein
MSSQRAAELTRIKTDLQAKFADALKGIDAKIESESREEEDSYATIGKCAADLSKATGSVADGVYVIRQFGGRRGGPAK